MPLDGFDQTKIDNLNKMVTAKAPLLQASLGVKNLPIKQTETSLLFPWFRGEINAENTAAYSTLISLLCKTAIEKKRVTAKAPETFDNEKFAMRVFLINLGLIGLEYKKCRALMMQNLTGNASFADESKYKAMQENRRKVATSSVEATHAAEGIPVDEVDAED